MLQDLQVLSLHRCDLLQCGVLIGTLASVLEEK
jgi:hypothetical protein